MKFLARALPCGQRSLPGTRRLERVLNEFFPNVLLLGISRFCVAEKLQVVQLHLLPGTLLPATEILRTVRLGHGKKTSAESNCFVSKRFRRICLRSRDQAVCETQPPRVLAFFFVSHSLLFALDEDAGQAGVRLSYTKSKRILKICQEMPVENSILGSFFT